MQRPTNYETLLNEWDQAEALKTALQKLYMSVRAHKRSQGMLTFLQLKPQRANISLSAPPSRTPQ
jgi:hypothetical protein